MQVAFLLYKYHSPSAPNDYENTTMEVTFGNRLSNRSCFQISIVDDQITENDELFYIVLSDAPRVRFDPESFASITIVDVDCGNLENPLNGQVFLSGTDFGSEATYICDEGFALSENSTRICQENEEWSNNEPVCVGMYIIA